MKNEKIRFFVFTFFCITILILFGACRASNKPFKASKYTIYSKGVNKVKPKSILDVQYQDAYKYNSKGKRYKKHYRQMNKRKKKRFIIF